MNAFEKIGSYVRDLCRGVAEVRVSSQLEITEPCLRTGEMLGELLVSLEASSCDLRAEFREDLIVMKFDAKKGKRSRHVGRMRGTYISYLICETLSRCY